MVGIGLAISGHFPYAVKNSGAMVLGNLNFAIVSVFPKKALSHASLNPRPANAERSFWSYPLFNCQYMLCQGMHSRFNIFMEGLTENSGHLYGGDWVARLFFRYGKTRRFFRRLIWFRIPASWRHSQRLRALRSALVVVQSRV